MANWALVIGCDGYWDPAVSLKGAVRDALDMRSWLLDRTGGGVPKQNLTLLITTGPGGAPAPPGVTAKEATRDSISLAITDLLNRSAGDDGTLYVFFAGHGLTARVNFVDEPAIVPADFTPNLTTKALSVRSILEQFTAATLPTQFFFLDACRNIPFEGEFNITGLDRPKRADYTRAAPNQYACFATSPGLKAHEQGQTGDERGAFTGALLRALAGEGRAKVWDPENERYLVRFDELFRFVEDDVVGRRLGDENLYQRPRRHVSAGGENPVLAAFADGSFLDEPLEVVVDPPEGAGDVALEIAGPYDAEDCPPPLTVPFVRSLPPRTYSVRAHGLAFVPRRRAWPVELYGPATVRVELQPVALAPQPAPAPQPPSPQPVAPQPAAPPPAGGDFDVLPEAADAQAGGWDGPTGISTTPLGPPRTVRGPGGLALAARLTVVGPDPMAIVEAIDEAGRPRTARAQLELTEAGRYRVRVRLPGGTGPEQLVEVLPGEEETVHVEAPAPDSALVDDLSVQSSYDRRPGGVFGLAEILPMVAVPGPAVMLALSAAVAVLEPWWGERLRRLDLAPMARYLAGGPGVLVVVGGEVPPPGDLTVGIGGEWNPLVPVLGSGRVVAGAVRAQPGQTGAALVAIRGLDAADLVVAIHLEENNGPAIVVVEVGAGGEPVVFQHGLPRHGDSDEAASFRAADSAERFARAGRPGEALAVLAGVPAGVAALALRGYLLFDTGASPADIGDVARELSDAAPTLPDGRVIDALAHARGGDSRTAAASAGEALALGLPIFASGLAAAVDLLDTDPPAGMVTVTERLVRGQLFTTLAVPRE